MLEDLLYTPLELYYTSRHSSYNTIWRNIFAHDGSSSDYCPSSYLTPDNKVTLHPIYHGIKTITKL